VREAAQPNETIRLLHERASVRQFDDRKIEPGVLRAVLEAGAHAPTGGLQPYSIIVIEDDETKRKILELDGGVQKQIVGAPVDLLFCLDMHRNRRWAELEAAPFTAASSFEEWWISFQDTVICAQSIVTAADALGLGTVYIGTVYWYFQELREMFGMPAGVFPVVLLCMGYPRGDRPAPRKKLGIDVVVHNGRYREIPDADLLAALAAKHGGRIEATDERVEGIAKVCRRVGGPVLERKCLDKMRENGYISPVQFIYGLVYCADKGVEGNARYLELLEGAGFDWFKPHALPEG
jgi:FMN reductase [NAD(P)H]